MAMALDLLRRHESGEEIVARIRADAGRPATSKLGSTDTGIGAQILRRLGVGKMKLLASPRKMPSMAGFGLEVSGYGARDKP